jgi:RHH-type proline utilization regulon transcriptional repressor/proline dehydrogenase/delta 1-pyrroline-5-carboxylate dehydrogenase
MKPAFATDHLQDETACVEALQNSLQWDQNHADLVAVQAGEFVRQIREQKSSLSEIETFLEQYPLSSAEGLALMTLAEALLRIPDSETADTLIAEKMASGQWGSQGNNKGGGLMKLAGVGMNLAQKTLGSFLGDIGRPVIRKSMQEAIRRIGHQFVIGETIKAALNNAASLEKKGYLMSYDMLGEGARTAEDAERYFDNYVAACDAIGQATDAAKPPQQKAGMSVKLSALYPRYSWAQRDKCVPALIERLTLLCRRAASYNIALTVDAEEADRLELAWQIISTVAANPEFKDWKGFGLAIQAYDKRAFRLIDEVIALARQSGRTLQVRLVKGAYWDTEIKRAQIAGLKGYPVFTRKVNTDLSYLACARKLLANRGPLYPMFATHNAHTVAAVLDLAGASKAGFEFQRLYGMGSALHDQIITLGLPTRIYAPTGSYEDLLPYLVRRMLENGANTSFVNKVRGDTAVQTLIADPVLQALANEPKHQPNLPLPKDIYGTGNRSNSSGPDLSDSDTRTTLMSTIPAPTDWRATAITPVINGEWPIKSGAQQTHFSPASLGEPVVDVWDTTADRIDSAFAVARKGFVQWSATPAATRAATLRKTADLLEENTSRLIGLLQHEGGKTLGDCISEIREAVDFCRYYAEEGEDLFGHGETLPGPTGEENVLTLAGRGVFICISPWNFPLAIFMGQISAALMAGNSVIAKPAEQTPAIAFEAVRLLIEAGVPPAAMTLLPGDGRIGAALTAHKDVAGVAFTGSTEVARLINRTLAAKDTAIVPLIAETGGQNAMIVDSSALPEQVVDDVILSAFGSAGQRCSALRVLYVQEEIADRTIKLLQGALKELVVGDPRKVETDIGPVIDRDALNALLKHRDYLGSFAKLIGEAPLPAGLNGFYIAPSAYEIDSLSRLQNEVFGPVLHVIRYAAKDRAKVIADINATGYGLTFGLHSRLQGESEKTAQSVEAGNIYINRSMIGAVVGVQPFGGRGLSGTGPKAGGPYYLHRFATEKVVSTNTTATGGNITLLLSLED